MSQLLPRTDEYDIDQDFMAESSAQKITYVAKLFSK